MQAEPPEQSQENFSPRSHNSPQDPANVRSKQVERRSGWAMGSVFLCSWLFFWYRWQLLKNGIKIEKMSPFLFGGITARDICIFSIGYDKICIFLPVTYEKEQYISLWNNPTQYPKAFKIPFSYSYFWLQRSAEWKKTGFFARPLSTG